MCGICGVVQFAGEPRPVISPEVLDSMTDAMTHRGPNDRGVLQKDGIALGVRRLSIVDVEGGHQPFANEAGTVWAAQNGELYNHGERRAELVASGHRFASRCDTEVIPHLYEEHGDDFVSRLRGMFGLVVWDEPHRRAVVARDRLGIKPMYYAVAGDVVVFASELKSLLASGLVQPALDYDAIAAYLTLGFVPGPATPLRGVRKLAPGCRLIVEPGVVREERYWAYPQPEEDEDASAEEWGERFLAELRNSVRLRLMSDVPLGAMLSGGLDSSLIVALMAEEMTEPVKTFSIGFADGDSGSELDDARLVANAFGTDHHELELSLGDSAVDLAELVWHLDEPLGSVSALGFHALSELAARHVTVALSGQGADELLGGYTKHLAASLAASPLRFGRPALALAQKVVDGRMPSLGRAVGVLKADDAAARLLAMSGRLDEQGAARLFAGPLAGAGPSAAAAAVARVGGAVGDPLAQTLYLDAQLGLVDDMLHYFDRTSMAHSLEVRVPFLDHEVVELAARIPTRYKVKGLTRKYLLRRVARGLVPDHVIDKRKVGFFHRSVSGWLRAQLAGPMSDYLLGPSPRYAEFLDRGEVERLVRRNAAGDGRSAHLLLGILMLEIWLSTYLPRATSASRGHVALRA